MAPPQAGATCYNKFQNTKSKEPNEYNQARDVELYIGFYLELEIRDLKFQTSDPSIPSGDAESTKLGTEVDRR